MTDSERDWCELETLGCIMDNVSGDILGKDFMDYMLELSFYLLNDQQQKALQQQVLEAQRPV